jgi:hypothetical protein
MPNYETAVISEVDNICGIYPPIGEIIIKYCAQSTTGHYDEQYEVNNMVWPCGKRSYLHYWYDADEQTLLTINNTSRDYRMGTRMYSVMQNLVDYVNNLIIGGFRFELTFNITAPYKHGGGMGALLGFNRQLILWNWKPSNSPIDEQNVITILSPINNVLRASFQLYDGYVVTDDNRLHHFGVTLHVVPLNSVTFEQVEHHFVNGVSDVWSNLKASVALTMGGDYIFWGEYSHGGNQPSIKCLPNDEVYASANGLNIYSELGELRNVTR